MLEGLEVSEETFNNSLGNPRFHGRFEAEFYLKKYKEYLLKISSFHYRDLGSIAFVTDGEHGNAKTSETGFAKYYGARNVLKGILSDNDVEYITEEHHKKIIKSKLFPNDVLISCVGANIGYAAIVPNNVGEANIVRNVALIRTKDEKISNGLLFAYFQSKFGKDFFVRMATGNAQPLVSLDYIKSIPVVVLSTDIQTQIELLIEKSKFLLSESVSIYTEAENLLLQELGLDNWQPIIKNNNTKTLKESFIESGRIDAEYYQPKYDELLELLSKLETKPLGKIVSIKKSIEPGSDAYQTEGIPFIRVADLSKNGISESAVYLDPLQYGDDDTKSEEEETKLEPKKDTILLSKDGSVGIAYKLEEDIKGITSGAILHLTITDEEFLPDYLTLVLNSIVVKLQAERDAGGSIIQHWKPDEIKQVIIPKLNQTVQAQITEKVQESFKLQKHSKDLLEAAKTAVEIAIEQDEQTALNYLQNFKDA